MPFSAILFDFNGVLWWDGPLQEEAWNQMALELRGRPFSAEEAAVHLHGRSNTHTLEYLAGRPLPPTERERLGEKKEGVYRALCLARGPAFCLSLGAEGLLDWLAARSIPRAIATSSGCRNIEFFRQHLGLDRWFAPGHIVFDDGTVRGKPAPDLWLRATAAMDRPPARCVAVDDSRAGLQAAVAAGIGYVVALGARPRLSELAALPGVGEAIESLADLRPEALFPPNPE